MERSRWVGEMVWERESNDYGNLIGDWNERGVKDGCQYFCGGHPLSCPHAGRGRVCRPGERLEPDTCVWGHTGGLWSHESKWYLLGDKSILSEKEKVWNQGPLTFKGEREIEGAWSLFRNPCVVRKCVCQRREHFLYSQSSVGWPNNEIYMRQINKRK